MNYTLIVCLIIIIVVLITEFVINIVASKSENSISAGMISAGISLVLTAFPGIIDSLLNVINGLLGQAQTSSEINIIAIICGTLLILFGLIYERNIKDRIFVLNILGVHSQFEISDKQNILDLKLTDFKVKEIVVDFVDIFKSGINEDTNNVITKKIKKECTKFIERSKDFKGCYTGMAPIPYTILAGTYLANGKVERYFEYKRSDDKFYELNKKSDNKYEKLKSGFPQNLNIESIEVVVAISITRKIQEQDMLQFNGMDILGLGVDNPSDNIIQSKRQLHDYKMEIIDFLENIKIKYSKIEKIHLLASIPSCMSLEIGKMIALNGNRIPQIISYHYAISETPKYPFGIVVTEKINNSEKGKIISC